MSKSRSGRIVTGRSTFEELDGKEQDGKEQDR